MNCFVVLFLGVLYFVWKGVKDLKENHVKSLTKYHCLYHLCLWKIGLYHNQRVLDESHVFDVVVLHV